MNQLRELPIGVQDFEKLRTRKLLYIDKTQYVADLLQGGGIYFLSRPRRFGKSLFLSTLAAYFEGKKELFRGLYLEKAEEALARKEGREAWQTYPVFYINLNDSNYEEPTSLSILLNDLLFKWEQKYGAVPSEQDYYSRFRGLISRACEQTGKKAVILVDEYDKPLFDTLHLPKLHETFRNILSGFYSVIKGSDSNLRFVFLTGVTRFGKLTIFSGLNSLKDITMDARYSSICGVTETELVENFAPEIEALATESGTSYEGALADLKKWYDGYLFAEKGEHVYNPFSLLNALESKELVDYWYATGTPTFLVQYLRTQKFYLPDLENEITLGRSGLRTSPMDTTSPLPLLFQTGYLTLIEYLPQRGVYRLGFPNEEVRYGFMKNLLQGYYKSVADSESVIANFLRDIYEGKVDAFMTRLKAIIGGIPYDTIKKDDAYREHDGEVAVYLIFSLMGQFTQTEVHTPSGRADAVVHTENAIYLFEFKMEGAGTPEDALAQIKERGYANRYLAADKKIVCIGVTFDSKTRNISEWRTAHFS